MATESFEQVEPPEVFLIGMHVLPERSAAKIAAWVT